MSDAAAQVNNFFQESDKLSKQQLNVLVTQCIEGDSRAFAELFRRYKEPVYKMVYQILGPVSTVDEIIQDIFVEIYKSLKSFEWKAQFSTWAYRITINVCMQYLRDKHIRLSRFGPQNQSNVEQISGNIFPDGQSYAESKERIKKIYEALDQLHPKKRVVVVLHDINGNTMEEIAEITKVPLGTIKSRLFHGRDKLKKLLKEIIAE